MSRVMLAIALIIGLNNPLEAQDNFSPDSAYFGIFAVDADSFQFSGGAILSRPACSGCDTTVIPLNTQFDEPGDFGSITFTHQSVTDTIFAGEIIWMGVGDILYPQEWLPADSFMMDFTTEQDPQSTSYWDLNGEPLNSDSMISAADQTWEVVSSLTAFHNLTTKDYHLGYYYYAPEVGTDESEYDMWIVFVYRGATITGINSEDYFPKQILLSANYPNPFNPTTTIDYELPQETEVQILVYNMLGQKVATLINARKPAGRYSVTWNVSNDIVSGVYLYQIVTPGFVETRKMIYLK